MYHEELKVLEKSKKIIDHNILDKHELFNEYKILLNHYEKLLTDTIKITKIADMQNHNLIEMKEKLIQLNKHFKHASITDSLTDIHNRAKCDEILINEIKRFERFKRPFSLILIDIDFFKRVNDNYGHNYGDKVLIAFANVLKISIRQTDFLARWGGEEFMIVLSETNKVEAFYIAEKLRKEIEKMEEFPNLNITASFGVSEYSGNMTVDNLIEKADEALYKSKENGRNRVSVSE